MPRSPSLLVAWNVWKNYEDVLLGSEILRLSDAGSPAFSRLRLVAQGGFPEPPSPAEARYLDSFVRVEVDDGWEAVRLHPKFKGVYRVLEGIKSAYRRAAAEGCEFALVTNADAWCLSPEKVAGLLQSPGVRDCAVAARVGPVTALSLSYGDYAPFFDDHFIILNVPRCRDAGVFDYDVPAAYQPHFLRFGGIHYMLCALMDERVPPGLFHAYTDLSDCLNHFGEPSGFNLLPWQFQPSFDFLHANCAQDPYLHPLRAALLRVRGLARFPGVRDYCARYPEDSGIWTDLARGSVAFRRSWKDALVVPAAYWGRRLWHDALRLGLLRRRIARETAAARREGREGSVAPFLRYRHVLPPTLASRRARR